jgi:hypothetical protein
MNWFIGWLASCHQSQNGSDRMIANVVFPSEDLWLCSGGALTRGSCPPSSPREKQRKKKFEKEYKDVIDVGVVATSGNDDSVHWLPS